MNLGKLAATTDAYQKSLYLTAYKSFPGNLRIIGAAAVRSQADIGPIRCGIRNSALPVLKTCSTPVHPRRAKHGRHPWE